MFHSTAMVPDYDRAVGELQTIAGLRVLEYGESEQPEIGRRGGMTWIGDNSIEIGQPIVDTGGAARFVARHGGGMHSVALQVGDLDATVEHINRCGVRIAARPLPEMCFTDPRDTGGVFFEWAVFELDVDPRFGAAPPPYAVPPLMEIGEQSYTGALVDDPVYWADTFARLFGTEVTFEDPHAGPGSPRAGVSMQDSTLALYKLVPERSDSLWGRTYGAPRAHLMALRVDDLDEAAGALTEAGIKVVRTDDSTIIVDPDSTGGIQTAFVDRLLPGDPRSVEP